MRRGRLVVLFASLTAGGPLSAQGLPPASADELLAGTRSCIAATSASGVDRTALEKDGWRRATMSSGGKPVENGLNFFSRGSLILILNLQAKTPICTFSARVRLVQDYAKVQAAMAAAYGAAAGANAKGEQIYFTSDHHIVDLASTGSNDKPGVRIAVGPIGSETK